MKDNKKIENSKKSSAFQGVSIKNRKPKEIFIIKISFGFSFLCFGTSSKCRAFLLF